MKKLLTFYKVKDIKELSNNVNFISFLKEVSVRNNSELFGFKPTIEGGVVVILNNHYIKFELTTSGLKPIVAAQFYRIYL